MKVDHVILAIGQQPQFGDLAGNLVLSKWGTIQADPVTQETGQPGIFAGGDAVTGASTVVAAFGAGKRAAESIDRWLRRADIGAGRREEPAKAPACWGPALPAVPRVKPSELEPAGRTADFREIIQPLDDEAARREAGRCLGCGSVSEGLAGSRQSSSGGLTGPIQDRARLVILETEPEKATLIGGICVQPASASQPIKTVLPAAGDDDVILCRCERVTIGQVRRMIRAGVTDLNQLKAVLCIGMGACGSKTCGPLLASLLRREGVPADRITAFVQRPLTAEVPLGFFAGQPEKPPRGQA
jgi:bacterioferritin-associated ferredoxin